MSIKKSSGTVEISMDVLYDAIRLELDEAGINPDGVNTGTIHLDYMNHTISVNYVDSSEAEDEVAAVSNLTQEWLATGAYELTDDGYAVLKRNKADEDGCGGDCGGCTCNGVIDIPGLEQAG